MTAAHQQPQKIDQRSTNSGNRGATSPTRLAIRERDEKAASLRRAGATWDQIARQLGYGSPAAAYNRFMILMHEYPRETIEAARDLEADRLDQLQRALWPKALAGDQAAISTVLRIMDQRARLLGYNAPVRKEITVLTENVVDEALAKAAEQHAIMVEQLRALEQRAAITAEADIVDGEVVEDDGSD